MKPQIDTDKIKIRMDRINRINKIQTKERFGFYCNPVILVNPVYSSSLLNFIGVYLRLSAADRGFE